MPNPVLAALTTEAAADITVMDGAATVIGGIEGMVQNAVSQALANGATSDQLAPFDAVVADLNAHRSALAAAIAAVPPAPQVGLAI